MKDMCKVVGFVLMAALLIIDGCGRSETPQEKFKKRVSQEIPLMEKKIEILRYYYNDKLVKMHQEFDEQVVAALKQHNEALAAVQKQYFEAAAEMNKKLEVAKQELAGLKPVTDEDLGKAIAQMDQITAKLEKSLVKAESQFK